MPDTIRWGRDKHAILGGKVNLCRRGDSDNWHCSTFRKGRNRRKSTKEESLPLARQIAEDWYLELRGKARVGHLPEQIESKASKRPSASVKKIGADGVPLGLKCRMTFDEAADQFTAEYGVINHGEVSERWVAGHQSRLSARLRPYFADKWRDEIDGGSAQVHRLFRMTNGRKGKPPARNTINSEIATLNHVLGTAFREGAMHAPPDLSPPFKSSNKVGVQPWFSSTEYKQLHQITAENGRKTKRDEDRWYAEQFHDLVLFQANTGLHPDETKNLQFRDIEMVRDEATGELILEISVRGKRGVGFCKSMAPLHVAAARAPRSPKRAAISEAHKFARERARWALSCAAFP